MDACDHTLPAALALGEASEEEVRAAGRHLRHCAACRGELAALRDLVATARAAPVDDGPVPPPARIRDAIAAEVSGRGRGGAPRQYGRRGQRGGLT